MESNPSTATAGLRRKSKVKEAVEVFSNMRSIRALEQCDVAVFMVDAAHFIGLVAGAHIGRAIGLRARAFGMHVMAITRSGERPSKSTSRVVRIPVTRQAVPLSSSSKQPAPTPCIGV